MNTNLNPTAVEELNFLFDLDGFFINPEQWDIALAQRIAHSEDMGEMDALQTELLLTLRDEFQKFGAVTALSHICHLNGLDADCLHQLFRSPRQAWRIAGLPNPGEEAKAYLA
ncbi:MAG: TusE/DsrC/DsvC family sulfur relay protein [Thiobacillus sp.]|uniref:TusE/DsrC/DsvC family sulfur relay protein n=1 Tax=Thiobacillus sp. TaxID=924 RepID=UPI002734F6E1|nr:TusE/DsrC/DsvC family sulfur relay protein [Thiobacillus sp.]MDP3419289.1 TusE/DsrC/DsvC family sulfur relay protein [Thiobacillus sp.]MDP3583963.1 TusE/DsrC/DsvC family sulfur relay protein [Thiobacillus sp.]